MWRWTLACFLSLGFVACVVSEIDLAGKACDATHPCAQGFRCEANVCVRGTTTPAGPDAAVACVASERQCRNGDLWGCVDGGMVPLEVCSSQGWACEPGRGCLPPCGEGCPSGWACDKATTRCVKGPACVEDLDCEVGDTCVGGSCVPPSIEALVQTGGASAPANVACAGADGGVADAAATAKIAGYLVTPTGVLTSRTIGFQLSIYEAAAFNASETATPIAETTVGQGIVVKPVNLGDAGIGDAEVPVGWFSGVELPLDTPLVAVSSGPDSVTTVEYFSVPSSQKSSGLSITSFDTALWDSMEGSVGHPVEPGRAGLLGIVYDCDSLKVEGATAGVSTPLRAYYTYPAAWGINPDAEATARGGRFFFFDLPVTPLSVTANVAGTFVTREFRPLPDSVTVISFRPGQ